MVIASQYVRGKGVVRKCTIGGEPYYMILSGDVYAQEVEGALPYDLPVAKAEANGGAVSIETVDVKVGERAFKCDASAGLTAQASIEPVTFQFTPAYPYRAHAWGKVSSLTKLYFGITFLAHRKNTDHISDITKRCTPERFFEVINDEAQSILPKSLEVGTWHEFEIIETSDTEYYVEIDGDKYGPFTKPVSGKATGTSGIGPWSTGAASKQLIYLFDDYLCWRPTTTYDPAGATAPDKLHVFYDDVETESWDLPFTKTTAAGGSISRAAVPYSGSYSMFLDTSGAAADKAYVDWARSASARGPLDYPIWHDLYARFASITDHRYIHSPCLLFDAVLDVRIAPGYYAGPPEHFGWRVNDTDGWHDDLATLELDTWYHLQLEELSDTKVKAYVDGVALGDGAEYTKYNAGKMTGWRVGDDGGDPYGQAELYVDLMQVYREL